VIKDQQIILCDVYKSTKKAEVYLYVDRAEGLDRVPESLILELVDPEVCFSFKLTPDRKLARGNSISVIKNLKEQGYYLQMPPVILGQLGKRLDA
jgi:uncharacterized protein YcgL (UPF0745 family)